MLTNAVAVVSCRFPAQVLAGLPDDQRAALLAAQAEGAMTLDGVDEVNQPGSTVMTGLFLRFANALHTRLCHKRS
jgi:hypothetical protein